MLGDQPTTSALLETFLAASNAPIIAGKSPAAEYTAVRLSPPTLRVTLRSPRPSIPESIQRKTASCWGTEPSGERGEAGRGATNHRAADTSRPGAPDHQLRGRYTMSQPALRRPRPQPRIAFTYSAKWNRCVPMRQTLPRFANA